jgi:hypothetical protein
MAKLGWFVILATILLLAGFIQRHDRRIFRRTGLFRPVPTVYRIPAHSQNEWKVATLKRCPEDALIIGSFQVLALFPVRSEQHFRRDAEF